MYKEFRLKIKELIEREKDNIGVKAVFSPLPPFVEKENYPLVAVQMGRQSVEIPATTGGQFRPELSAYVWIQVVEITQDTVGELRHNPTECERIQGEIETITEKVAEILRKNRSLEGLATETNIRNIDFEWKPSLFIAGGLIAGAIIELGGAMKAIQVEMI